MNNNMIVPIQAAVEKLSGMAVTKLTDRVRSPAASISMITLVMFIYEYVCFTLLLVSIFRTIAAKNNNMIVPIQAAVEKLSGMAGTKLTARGRSPAASISMITMVTFIYCSPEKSIYVDCLICYF